MKTENIWGAVGVGIVIALIYLWGPILINYGL